MGKWTKGLRDYIAPPEEGELPLGKVQSRCARTRAEQCSACSLNGACVCIGARSIGQAHDPNGRPVRSSDRGGVPVQGRHVDRRWYRRDAVRVGAQVHLSQEDHEPERQAREDLLLLDLSRDASVRVVSARVARYDDDDDDWRTW